MTERVMVLLILLLLLISGFALQPACAMRILDRRTSREEKYKSLLENVLQRGPVPPSGPSPCTFIPGQGSGSCPIAAAATLNGKNFAAQPARKAATHAKAIDANGLASSFTWLTKLFSQIQIS